MGESISTMGNSKQNSLRNLILGVEIAHPMVQDSSFYGDNNEHTYTGTSQNQVSF